ncbi:Abi family protein [Facklamia hominis]|uniref:Abi family protein n=1 Tax=Facklamia hominis TaxID=178214 RepID=UPI000C7BF040|nr:Abi family protein [Facklamia hominis]PKY92467.1 hypothetical protein CYJ56_07695 [Facklamia hominis]WPJ90951.1 Abi family protein [Facklamia hominis]
MKPFKTLDEQLDLLESRGLIINNRDKATSYLLEHSYYNVINVYSKFFQNEKNKFINGASFEEIRRVHIFDSELKSILFKYIIESEKHFKSSIAYRFGEKFKDIPYAYLQTSCYSDKNLISLATTISILSKVLKENINSNQPNSIKHYHSNHNNVPIWVLINELTFGETLYLYINLDEKLKNRIAQDMNRFLSDCIGKPTVLESHALTNLLFNLKDIRNCVAHNNVLFGMKCRNNVKYFPEIHDPYCIKKQQPRQDLFNMIIMMRCFLTNNQFSIMHNTILSRTKTLQGSLQTIEINKIINTLGFPNNWCNTAKKLDQNKI